MSVNHQMLLAQHIAHGHALKLERIELMRQISAAPRGSRQNGTLRARLNALDAMRNALDREVFRLVPASWDPQDLRGTVNLGRPLKRIRQDGSGACDAFEGWALDLECPWPPPA